ncbi:hypothetical protein CX676_17995 [Paracoccus zhejiangensis]|uniref:HTH LytTR-type domain-containing protein n=1 Tax=Paracoccus zhejiangensis TaxID=1077935 RepID=A0A2H5F2R7_9RHOB|nr:hypothetical protein CX676_17995 [Paracoccus zhejiangensis]
MSQNDSLKLHVVLVNGGIVHFTSRELRKLIYSRRVLILLAGFLLAIGTSDPTLFPSLPEYQSRLFYWTVSVALYLLLLPFWVDALIRFWPKISTGPLPMIGATVPLVIALTAFASAMPVIFGDLVPARGHSINWITIIKNCFIAQVIETIALVWLLPIQRLEAEKSRASDPVDANAAKPAAPAIRYVVLNGRSLPVPLIRSVRSAEHYLVVTTKTGTAEFRARMKDFLEQLEDGDGIQTHRSYWVSRAEAVEMSGSNVKTASGEIIPVSRGKLQDVRDWFRRQGKPH